MFNNETMINNINNFSHTLSPIQLDQFLTIVDKLNQLLVMANQDTEKAYQLYLSSLDVFTIEHCENTRFNPTINYANYNNNQAPLKH